MKFEYVHNLSNIAKSVFLLLQLILLITIGLLCFNIIKNINLDGFFYFLMLIPVLWMLFSSIGYLLNPERTISISDHIIKLRIRKSTFWWDFHNISMNLLEYKYYVKRSKINLLIFDEYGGKSSAIYFEFPEKISIKTIDYIENYLIDIGLEKMTDDERKKLLKECVR